MNNKAFNLLKEFIIRERRSYKFEITRQTELQKDLNIWGDDADDFFRNYSNEFDVDVSELELSRYFRDEGDIILPAVIDAIIGSKKKYTSLTVGDLEQGIMNGKLK